MGSTTKRFDGTLTSWNDERGFGFISPDDGTGQTFVHIKAFPPAADRPQLGTRLSFEVDHAADGKNRATRVRLAGRAAGQVPGQGYQGQVPGQPSRHPSGRFQRPKSPHGHPQRNRSRPKTGFGDYAMVVIFIAGYLAVNALWPLPLWVAGLYVGASVMSFIVYAVDKSAATNGRWRVSENTLLALGAVGGWPGAIIAQQTLRHKTKKASFRAAFWVTVAVNLIVFAVFATPLFAAVVERSAHPLF